MKQHKIKSNHPIHPAMFILLALFVLTTACAKRLEGPDANYANMLAAYERIADLESQVDRRNLIIETGGQPVTLPAGLTITARVPPPPLSVPQMFRDYAYEAELQRDGVIISVLGGQVAGGLFGWLNKREDRKLWTDALSNAGGYSFNADNQSEVTFSGGTGDRLWGYHGGDYLDASPQSASTATSTTDTDNSNQNNPVNPDPVIVTQPEPLVVNPVIVPAP